MHSFQLTWVEETYEGRNYLNFEGSLEKAIAVITQKMLLSPESKARVWVIATSSAQNNKIILGYFKDLDPRLFEAKKHPNYPVLREEDL